MKKFLLVLLMLGMVGNAFANWDSSTDMQTETVAAAVTQVQNSLKAIDGTSGTVPTNVNTKNLQLDGLTSGTITLTPAAIAGTTAITVPAVAGTLVTSAGTGTNIDIGALLNVLGVVSLGKFLSPGNDKMLTCFSVEIFCPILVL